MNTKIENAKNNLKECPHCKSMVDKRASKCPHCGGTIMSPLGALWTLGIAIGSAGGLLCILVITAPIGIPLLLLGMLILALAVIGTIVKAVQKTYKLAKK